MVADPERIRDDGEKVVTEHRVANGPAFKLYGASSGPIVAPSTGGPNDASSNRNVARASSA
jgi:hypothetical protein